MPKLSDIFKYISFYRSAGHQIGRKVGDMLEVLTYASLYYDKGLRERLHIEPKLYGFADAGHKVEFLITKDKNKSLLKGGDVKQLSHYIGFIECKKVGVEQTVNASFKKIFSRNKVADKYHIKLDQSIKINITSQGMDKYCFIVYFEKINNNITINVKDESNNNIILTEDLVENYRLIIALFKENGVEIIGNKKSLRDFNYPLINCKILEISNFTDEVISLIQNDCLPGPQTPEKAKQASFVALDIRKKRFNSFDKQTDLSFRSVLVLTEIAHWEQKSKNMILSCIDLNLVVPDSIVIEAFEELTQYFKENRTNENFYDLISKDNFEKDENIKKIILNVINTHHGKIFQKIEHDGSINESLVALCYSENQIKITSEI